jgi:glucose/arabinose dehydrogenase
MLALLVGAPLPAAGQQRPPLPASRPAQVEALRPLELTPMPATSATAGGSDDGAGSTALVSTVPPGFTDELVSAGWNQAVGVTFASDGRAFVWQRNGRVYLIINGIKLSQPLLDVSQEVANWGDHGLIGFALDPDFSSNGYVYLLYVVDYHYLTKFGTPEYDPAANDYSHDTIGRITRYTATAASGYSVVDPASRLVLVGESITTGIPISGSSHGVGSLVFGEDGSLLASTGDANPGDGSGTLLSDGIIQAKENVASFRSQLVDCLSGKVLRIDPATGDGLPGNPWFDPFLPRSPHSRVWTVGLRNPARMTLRPGTGSGSRPGTLCVGDVGAELAEELDIVPGSALDLGWPIYEGLLPSTVWASQNYFNKDAINPLSVPGHGSPCPLKFFTFQQLLVQDSLHPPSWPNPCDPGQPIITGAPTFVHHRPVVEWLHNGPARVPTYDAAGAATVAVMGTPESPVAGSNFLGNCSIGGAWSTHAGFPPEYQDGYFHGDYGVGWIRFARFDENDTLLSIEHFADPVGRIVNLAWDDTTGSLWYINYKSDGIGELHRIRWVAGSNLPPVATAKPALSYGPAPKTVAFDGSSSSDPEGGVLHWSWDFGDGTPASLRPNPVHIFPSEDITASGTIVGKVFELDPPGTTAFISNPDPEVMRDGDYPPEGSANEQRQYDTIHVSGGVPDKNGICWMGYAFPTEHTFIGMVYEEGVTYLGGGWFDTWSIDVRQGGRWVPVAGAVADPPYPPADGAPSFQTFEFRIPPTTGDAIRIYGAPGGVSPLDFITIGELRAIAEPQAPVEQPTNVAVTLTVVDDAGAEDSAVTKVSLNNAPPQPVIVAPADLGTYPAEPSMVELVQDSIDHEQGGAALSCVWQVILHHNTHTHPGPLVEECAPSPQVLVPEGCGDGSVYYNEIRLTVTDPLGLSTTRSHFLFPACDQNLNGIDDALDISGGASLDADADGIPDEAQTDCNANGEPDLYELFLGRKRDLDGDGIPDDCQSPWGVQHAPHPDLGPAEPPP